MGVVAPAVEAGWSRQSACGNVTRFSDHAEHLRHGLQSTTAVRDALGRLDQLRHREVRRIRDENLALPWQCPTEQELARRLVEPNLSRISVHNDGLTVSSMFTRCLDPALEIRLVGRKRLVEGEPSRPLVRRDGDLVRSVHHAGGIREADKRIKTTLVEPTVRPDLDDARKDIRVLARTRRGDESACRGQHHAGSG